MASKRRTVRAWDMDIFARVLAEMPDGKWIARVERYNRLAREKRSSGAMFLIWKDCRDDLPPVKPPEISRPIDIEALRRVALVPTRSNAELTARYNAETRETRSESGIERACRRYGIERARVPKPVPIPEPPKPVEPPEVLVKLEGTGLALPEGSVKLYREVSASIGDRVETREQEVAAREAIDARNRADTVDRWRREWKRLRRDWVPFRLEASA